MSEAPLVLRVKNRVFASNSYICRTARDGACILIDPGLDREGIEEALESAGLVPRAVFCTHGHFDHLGSAEHFRRRHAIPLHLHRADARVAQSANFLLMAFKIPAHVDIPQEYVAVDDGFTWGEGDDVVRYLHMPGHTPGSSFVLFRDHVFTGDTLYRDGVGLVKLPGEDVAQLTGSLRRVWDLLSDSVEIHPGHGGSAPFGEIKRNNAPLRRALALEEPAGP